MLQFDSKAQVIDGVSVFADHARPDLFWYLPGPAPQLARRDPEDVPQFTLITYRPETANSDVKGGGFLTMETVLKLDRSTERRILSRLAPLSDGPPTLAPVPLDEGSVRIVALDLEGGGGTTADPAPPDSFRAVEKILGATTPSMSGDNNALFCLVLSQEGAIILDQAFKQDGAPVGVIYEFSYTGLRPALDVEITANYKRIYDHLSMGIDLSAGIPIGGVPVYLNVGIDLAFEKLVQEGVIEIKVINFSTEDDKSNKEQWALDFFKNTLLKEWFAPTLAPIQPSTGAGGGGSGGGTTPPSGSGSGGGTAPPTGGGTAPPSGSGSGGGTAPPSGSGSGGGTAPPSGSGSGGGTAPPTGGGSGGGTAPPVGGGESPAVATLRFARAEYDVVTQEFVEETLAPATMSRTIDNAHGGRDVRLTQETGARQVTLHFSGQSRPSSVEIGGTSRPLNSGGGVSFNVDAGATVTFRAVYPAVTDQTETFRLMFTHNMPQAGGWNTSPPSRVYTNYLSNQTFPVDTAFQRTRHSDGSLGAEALRHWIAESNAPVTIAAHASWEGNPSSETLNRRLTERRLDVARGILGSAVAITEGTAQGFTRARGARRLRDPSDQVAEVTRQGASAPETTITGSVTRPAGGTTPPGSGATPPGSGATPPGSGTTPPGSGTTPPGSGTTPPGSGATPPGSGTTPPGSGTTPPGSGATPPGSGATPPGSGVTPPQMPNMGVKLGFKLQKIEQIEDKKLTFRYNRQQAVQRTHAPQGAIALMAADLAGPPHFITVDLDSSFFRTIDIKVDNPVDYDRIGLMSTDVQLEYGDRAVPATLKRKDMSFQRGGQKTDSHSFFLNEDLDLAYRVQLQYHYDPMSGWDGRALSYEMEPEETLDRTLLINPFHHFGFLEIKVLPGDLDRGMIRQTDVHLRYDGGDWTRDRMIVVRPDSPEQLWKLRIDDPEQRSFSYSLRHHLTDGSVREIEPVTETVPSVTVNDPFDDPLIVEFIPNFDGSTIQKIFVKVIYADEDNDYRREEDLSFEGALLQPQRLRIARIDPTKRAYSFQITALGNDHTVTRLPPVTSEEPFVFLGEHIQV